MSGVEWWLDFLAIGHRSENVVQVLRPSKRYDLLPTHSTGLDAEYRRQDTRLRVSLKMVRRPRSPAQRSERAEAVRRFGIADPRSERLVQYDTHYRLFAFEDAINWLELRIRWTQQISTRKRLFKLLNNARAAQAVLLLRTLGEP